MVEVITEIIGRTEEGRGILQPFRCMAADGNMYFAKGSNTTRQGLIREWVCANLGQVFGLPIPDVKILLLSEGLRDLSDLSWSKDLEYDYLFGTTSVEPCEVISFSDISNVPIAVRRDLLVFDAWIRNDDRYLTEKGGNPNVLIKIPERDAYIIDHNNAFAADFDCKSVRDLHVFSESLYTNPIDLADMGQYGERFDECLRHLDNICSQLPEEWIQISIEEDATIQLIRRTLEKHSDEDFWGWLT